MSKLTTLMESILEQSFPEPGKPFEVKTLPGTKFVRPNDSDSILEYVPHYCSLPSQLFFSKL